MARYLVIAAILLALPSLGASKRDRSNCKVELVKEASAGSILISFEAEDKEECERAKGGEVSIEYSGKDTPKKAQPSKKK